MIDNEKELLEEAKQRRIKRLEICNKCDFFNKETTACAKCGCIMNIKTNLKNVNCPIGKW